MICVAQFTGDEMWYRARIIDIPGNREVKVHYVDFGNTENTSIFKIRKILDTFLILPAQVQWTFCYFFEYQYFDFYLAKLFHAAIGYLYVIFKSVLLDSWFMAC